MKNNSHFPMPPTLCQPCLLHPCSNLYVTTYSSRHAPLGSRGAHSEWASLWAPALPPLSFHWTTWHLSLPGFWKAQVHSGRGIGDTDSSRSLFQALTPREATPLRDLDELPCWQLSAWFRWFLQDVWTQLVCLYLKELRLDSSCTWSQQGS